MNVTWIGYRFPVLTQTFHLRRLRILDEAGALSAVRYVHEGDDDIDHGLVRTAIRPIRRSVATTAMHVVRLTPLIASLFVTTKSNNGEGGRLGLLNQALLGIALGDELRGRDGWLHASFCTDPLTIAIFAAAVSGQRVSCEVHSPTSLARNPRLLEAKLRRCDLVMAISETTARQVKALLTEDRQVEVVRCGLDENELEGDGSLNPVKTFDVMAVGSLIRKKGHDRLIAAFSEPQLRGRRLCIVGSGPLDAELKQAAQARGADVTFTGALLPDELAHLRRQTRLGALMCRVDDGEIDGIPVALMEFLAAGIPVVATGVAAIPELVIGDESLLKADASPGDIASAILRLLTDSDAYDTAAAEGSLRVKALHNNRTESTRMIELWNGV